MSNQNVRLGRLDPTIYDGINLGRQRISKYLKGNWNQENFVVTSLSPSKKIIYGLHTKYESCSG